MAQRINRAIELLEQDQPIYYTGAHSGHVLTWEQGREDAQTWADYINVGMEHGSFNMTGLDAYMQGLVDGGPTASGHRTPAVIVETPVEGTVRGDRPLQRLAVPPGPLARRARHPPVPGRDAGCGARVRRILPLPDQHARRRPRPRARHARRRRPAHRRADLGHLGRRVHRALRPLAAQPRGRTAARHQDRDRARALQRRADADRARHRLRRMGAGRPPHVVRHPARPDQAARPAPDRGAPARARRLQGPPAFRSSMPAPPRMSRKASTKASGSSRAAAPRRPGSAAPTPRGRCPARAPAAPDRDQTSESVCAGGIEPRSRRHTRADASSR